jgi:hypothetical protein
MKLANPKSKAIAKATQGNASAKALSTRKEKQKKSRMFRKN